MVRLALAAELSSVAPDCSCTVGALIVQVADDALFSSWRLGPSCTALVAEIFTAWSLLSKRAPVKLLVSNISVDVAASPIISCPPFAFSAGGVPPWEVMSRKPAAAAPIDIAPPVVDNVEPLDMTSESVFIVTVVAEMVVLAAI